jgi:DnaJ-class molecular chaperone
MKYYEILELKDTATQEEIKRAFRRLSKQHHPDKGGDQEKFKEINEAYQTLSNPEKKEAYDKGTVYMARTKRIVTDVVIQIHWGLDDIKKGRDFSVYINRYVTCPDCHGIGSKNPKAVVICPQCKGAGKFSRQENTPFGIMMQETTCMSCRGLGETNTDPCPTCKGNKMVTSSAKENVKIPPNTLKFYVVSGKGHKVPEGISDLVIQLIFSDPEIHFTGNVFFVKTKVKFYDALLGTTAFVKLSDTTLKVSVPKESKNEQILKLSKGFCGIDVMVHLSIDFPTLQETREFVTSLFPEDGDNEQAIKLLNAKLS